MTTTTGDPSTLKTPASLSGGDLVSRLLAATPPYLYNVPVTPHSFFFSEMLRSFVQGKTEAAAAASAAAAAAASGTSAPRRRKRSWREARDRPLELTTKERTHHHGHHHHHHHHHHQQQQQQQQQAQEKYFQAQQQQQDAQLESASKPGESYEHDVAKLSSFEQKSSFGTDILKPVDENKAHYAKQSRNFLEDRPGGHGFETSQSPENVFVGELPKVKPEESQQDRKNCSYGGRSAYEERPKNVHGAQQETLANALADQKKLDFTRNFLPGLQAAKGFGMPGNVPNPDFLPGPLWYPPYPLPQSYPGIDPLHFFIDLRVSGHIWDRKLSERQLPFKSKHCSAFSVPQSKEYGNRPLNLTRDDSARANEENPRGTNYIMKYLTRKYREKAAKPETSTADEEDDNRKHTEVAASPKREESSGSSESQEEERKDLRALIGLELVVDYVKEPKGDPPAERNPQTTQ